AAAGSFQLGGLAVGTVMGGALPTMFAELPADALISPLAVPLLASLVVQALALALAALAISETAAGFGAVAVRDAVRPAAVVGSRREAPSSVASAPNLRLLLLADVAVGAVLASSENLWQPSFAALLPGGDVANGGGTLALGVIIGGSFGVGILGNLLATR